ncbi:MAG: lysophospholipid acyltransferase family protein [Pirellulaceae bacterium]
MDDASDKELLPPPVSQWMQNGFHRFLSGYLRRHFHAIALTTENRFEATIPADEPLIVYVNHPSWWDPLTAHFLNRRLFRARQFYAPIDADALEQYKVFGKLGFYGVPSDSSRGATEFLRKSKPILAATGSALWLTPEGRFADARDDRGTLMPGLSHLCSRMQSGTILPLAMEYVFWDERLPVCLARQGEVISVADYADYSKSQWHDLLENRLRQSQSALSELAIARSSAPFENFIHSRTGAGVFYDTFRRLKSWMNGQAFQSSHGDQFADERRDPSE